MSKLTEGECRRIETQMEVAMRYRNIMPHEQCFALIAMRLFMHRYGYDQVLSVIKQMGADVIANSVQKELSAMAALWMHAVKVEPPPPDKLQGVLADINMAAHHGRDKNVNERIYKIVSRLRQREDMIQQNKAKPTMVQ